MSNVHDLYESVRSQIELHIAAIVESLRAGASINFMKTPFVEMVSRLFVSFLSLVGSAYELGSYLSKQSATRLFSLPKA